MTRVLIVGPKDRLEPVIERLYALRLLHLLDHRGEDDVFGIGKPLPKASEVSERLVKLRSIANILQVEEGRRPEAVEALGDLPQKVDSLELNIREEDETRKNAEALVGDLTRRIDALRPFAALGLPLETYRGYESIEAIVGRVTEDVRGLNGITREHEAFSAPGAVAVFAAKEDANRVREHLTRFGFTALDVPEGEGDPKVLLARGEADRQKWSARLENIEQRLGTLRRKYARFLVQAEDALQTQIEKAEAPLRFAASEHSFVIDGWVPRRRYVRFAEALAAMPGLHLDRLEEAPVPAEEEGPPVLLRNPNPIRRFEFLTKLYATPRHDEVDPTAFLFLLFPVFFGLMIGDAGYGVIMIALGFALSTKLRDSPDFADLMRVILYGGVFAYIFGLLLFGEIFGIPFHPPPSAPKEVSWSAILGYNIPYSAPIHKLETVGVIDLLLLSIVASFVHLGIGYALGFVNEIRHDKRHAFSRIGWLFVLVGLFAFFAVLGRTPEGFEPSHRVVNQIFLDQPPLAWIPAEGVAIGAMTMPNFSLVFIGIGIAVLLPTEGLIAPMETISLLANMVSYTRLAGVTVAKGAVALAFNTMLLPLIINEPVFEAQGILELNANVLFIVLGFILLFLAHAMVLILGAISASVQAIRLSWVEFFLKFYKGGGQPFSPFGARATQTEV